jgi:hypothetical protein
VSDPPNGRRLANVVVSPERLARLAQEEAGIPATAQFVGASFNSSSHTYALWFDDPSFDWSADTEIIPPWHRRL